MWGKKKEIPGQRKPLRPFQGTRVGNSRISQLHSLLVSFVLAPSMLLLLVGTSENGSKTLHTRTGLNVLNSKAIDFLVLLFIELL